MDKSKASIYYRIQNQSLQICEKEIAHIFDQCRFDPRLMEVATEFLRDFWWNLDATLLNLALKKCKTPSAIKPALLAIIKNCIFPEKKVKDEFINWYEKTVIGLRNPVSPQLFYIGLNKIGSRSMNREVEESLPYFSRYGFFAKDPPFNKGKAGEVKVKSILLQKDRIDSYSALKSDFAARIKYLKKSKNLRNTEIIEKLGINRSFLSKILKNDLQGISVDYLIKKDAIIRRLFPEFPNAGGVL